LNIAHSFIVLTKAGLGNEFGRFGIVRGLVMEFYGYRAFGPQLEYVYTNAMTLSGVIRRGYSGEQQDGERRITSDRDV
jgi:hypothetical protein